jgi:hypothetical protein
VRLAAPSLFAAGLALVPFGCKSYDCKANPPAFELDIALAGDALTEASRIQSVTVEITIGTDHWDNTYPIMGELVKGTTSLAVDLTPPPTMPFELGLTLRAFDGASGQGSIIAETTQTFRASADACNRFAIQLSGVSPGTDGGVDAGLDMGMPSEGGVEAGGDSGDGGVDSGVDVGPPDNGFTRCAALDPNTVALYHFESGVTDETHNHNGTVEGTGQAYVMGACNLGLDLATSNANVLVASATDFNIASGSIDLWINPPQAPLNMPQGIFSSDSRNVVPGSIALFLACDGRLVAKLEGSGSTEYACSRFPVRAQRWSYVGINFGSPGTFEMFLNGNIETSTVPVTGSLTCTSTVPCGALQLTNGLTNGNPFVFGASQEDADPGMGNNLRNFYTGAIDELRISKVRRRYDTGN